LTDVSETWTWRELPILRIAVRDADGGAQFEDIAAETGLELTQVWYGAKALDAAGYLDAAFAGAFSGFVTSVPERGRREVGGWPSAESLADQLARAFEEAADREADPERKSALRAIAEGLLGAGRTVAVDLLSAYAKSRAGLP
jgi:hypothetical protein